MKTYSARRNYFAVFRCVAAGALYSGCWMLDTGYWMLDVGCWMLDAGCWMLDTGCWMLDAGYWMLGWHGIQSFGEGLWVGIK